jgi:hypothetical protein
MSDNEDRIKPTLRLVGEDGNAFMILGRAQRAALKAGWSRCDIAAFMEKARGGDYDHLLQVVMDHFNVI